MSFNSSPARNRLFAPSISTNPLPTLIDFFTTVNREWELLMKDFESGMMNGIISLSPCSTSAQDWIERMELLLKIEIETHNKNHKASRNKILKDAIPKPFGFELFLLGGNSDDDSSDTSDDSNNKNARQQKHANNQMNPKKVHQIATTQTLKSITNTLPLCFKGCISVNSKMSPWRGGVFEFCIEVFLGYPEHSCPLLYFTSPLCHPELRDGRHLPVVNELFASTRRVKNPFMLRDMLDAVRELFVQPVPMFKHDIVERAALDVKYRSVTSSFFGRETAFEMELNEVEERLKKFAERTASGEDAVVLSTSQNQLHSLLYNQDPAARFARQLEAEKELRDRIESRQQQQKRQNTNDDDEFEDLAQTETERDLPPYFLHTDLGIVLSEAHTPFLMQRKETQLLAKNKSRTANAQQLHPAESEGKVFPFEEKSLDDQCFEACSWIGKTATSTKQSSRAGVQEDAASFDKMMNRRLMRVFLPQVANVV